MKPIARRGALALPATGAKLGKVNVSKIKVHPITKKSVGGGPALLEGYLVPYGMIRVGKGKWEAMLFVAGISPQPPYFCQISLVFQQDNFVDPASGVSGSLYKTKLDDGRVTYVLLGAAFSGPGQKDVIFYDDAWNVKSHDAAFYLTGL